MSEPETKLEQRVRLTLTDVRILITLVIAGLVAVFGGGWAAFAQVRVEAREAAQEVVASIPARQARVEADLAEVRKDVAEVKRDQNNTQRVVLETSVNVKLIAEKLKVEPVSFTPKDGGP